jgi:glycosyltransferase involved in cell wall biosynthesis
MSLNSMNAHCSDHWDDLDALIRNRAFKMKINELRLIDRYGERNQDIKVSIIMPTWNRASVIRRAIDSVRTQRYGNFELIISDDGSSDATEEVVKHYCAGDQRIRYIRNEHSGVSRTRNIGLDHSTGQVIAYLDSDNVWSENYLLLMVNYFVDNPGINTLYCGLIIDTVSEREFISFKQYDRKYLLTRNYIDMNIFMHRRCLFDNLGGFNEEINVLEDWELILRYTKDNPPHMLECCLATYYFEKDFEHLSSSDKLPEIFHRIKQLFNEG